MSAATVQITRQASRFRWELVHQNGTTLAQSSQTYSRRSDAKRAFERTQYAIRGAQVVEPATSGA